MSAHRFLAFDKPDAAQRVRRELPTVLLNRYVPNEPRTRGQWKKLPAFQINWKQPRHGPNGELVGHDPRQSVRLTLQAVEAMLNTTGTFDYGGLGLYDPRCDWLDAAIDVVPLFHAPGVDATSALTFSIPAPLGSGYPFHPALDREGRALNSFQLLLLKRIGVLRRELVDRSENPGSEEWFLDFRNLVSECVSLIDTTLHQLYFKAKHDPLSGWKFDEASLGPRHGRRLSDKLNWVYKITGNHLNAGQALDDFVAIKDLRNHLQHFDPPSFCYSFEDAARWLDRVQGCALLNWAMRKCFRSPPCVPLVELLFQPSVQFSPQDPARPRIPQPWNTGYGSTSPPPLPDDSASPRRSTS
jgi:hypothetical protein